MKKTNWKDVDAGRPIPTKGGYICRIIAVEDDEQREYLKIHLDIAQGSELDGYYQDLYDRYGFYGLTHIRSYKETAKGLFKKFLKTLEECNQEFIADDFDNEPEHLLGLTVGVVTQLRRYTKQNGLDGTQIRAKELVTTEDIMEHNFTVPEDIDDRRITKQKPSFPEADPTKGFVDVTADGLEDEGLPFN